MDLKTIIGRLQGDDLSTVANATGVPYETLRRISTGQTPDPRVKTVERIAEYYAPKRREQRQAA
jgi:predicted transcriptional regulator